MSTHEIEDVLSSIRRLVSEDLRPASKPASGAPVPAAAADKLLLTPALRVVEAEAGLADDADAAAWPPGSFQPAAPMGRAVEAPVDQVVSRLGASVPEDEWESPFGDPEIWGGPDVPATQGQATAAGPVAPPRQEAVDDDPEAYMPAGFRAAPVTGLAHAEEEPQAIPDGAGVEGGAAPRRVLRRDVAPPQDDAAWADAAEAAVRADLSQDAEDEVIAGVTEAQAGGMVFDEEVLRDLVRDLIREELAGSLGERITRNVRKLVRAEIARAFAVRDFE